MRDVIRTAGVALCAPVTAAVLFAGSTTVAQAAAYSGPDYPGGVDCQQENCTALILGGAFPTNNLSYDAMGNMLGGYFSDYKRVSISHPGLTPAINVPAGSLRLENALETTQGPITVAGFSQGALIADQIMRELADDPDAPPPSELNFVIISDPTRGPLVTAYGKQLSWLGYDRMPPPESQYNVVVVKVEYDGVGDAPDRWWNFLALSNAYVGALLLHVNSMNVDLSQVPEENITVGPPNSRGGVTTTYFVPTERLPLVQLMPFLAPFEAQLRAQVDAGYSRNDVDASSIASAKSLAVEASTDAPTPVVEETADSSQQSVDAVEEAADETAQLVNTTAASSDGVDEDVDALVDTTDEPSDENIDAAGSTDGEDVDVTDDLADEVSDEDIDVTEGAEVESADNAGAAATNESANDASAAGNDSEAPSSKPTSDNDNSDDNS